MATYFDSAMASVERWEGSVPWMYQDTRGNITVGVGLMLPSAAAAQALPFQRAGKAASPEDVAAEYARVHALPMGRAAAFYRAAGKPELAAETIAHLLHTVLTGFETDLRRGVTGYDALPDGVKAALLDMAYNLGPQGLLRGYPKMLGAIQAGNWKQAAACADRRGISAARNEWARGQMLASVLGTVRGEAESILKRFGYGVVGAVATWLERLRR